ncbi:hypothetical protein IEQ34_015154 [Dendrobium chrysotoxum]|uniref:Uncharacterized protein n=1 Tax=Dendrobium chrysotoxum TaxID=161865 RepID=A0AAV7GNX0_DENCH|nr:hypothetical protein IEQ34_015154 [Dendrobium chrysotoxum]
MAGNSKDVNQRRTLDTTSKRSSSKNPKNTAGGGLTDASKIIPSSHDGDRRRSDDVASIITSDSLATIRKKFHVPNDVLIMAPKRTDRAHTPPQGFVAVYEMTLRAGLRFPPAPELLDIFKACGVALPQFLCRAITIIVGLIVFFRERGATLTVEYLSKMCKFTSDSYGRISCRANKKWLDFVTRDPSKNWYNSFFFIKNEWGLPEKWDKLKELPSSLHVGEGDILRILNFSDTESLQQELRYISRCVTEECLFKVGLSIQAHAEINQHKETLKKLALEKNALEKENKKLQDHLHERETTNLDIEAISLKAVEEFKKSVTYRREIQHLIQEAYEKLFDVEVKDLERQSLEEGFTRGFLKGVRLVHRKTGVDIEGLTPSQASEDSSPDSGDEDIESELKKALFSDDDDIDIV